jgi:hypothetical protein
MGSKILHGERKLTVAHIEKLARCAQKTPYLVLFRKNALFIIPPLAVKRSGQPDLPIVSYGEMLSRSEEDSSVKSTPWIL